MDSKIRTLALLQAQGAQRLQEITAQIKAIDRACAAILKQSPSLRARYVILTSIRGIGPVTAFVLLADLPELGTLDAKRAASLAGLAPVVRQSGAWQGKSFIQGGRKPPRDALYMPALVAIRFNPDMKAKYAAMTAAGKPPKVAIVAIMRKLLVLANALLRDGRPWSEAPLKPKPIRATAFSQPDTSTVITPCAVPAQAQAASSHAVGKSPDGATAAESGDGRRLIHSGHATQISALQYRPARK